MKLKTSNSKNNTNNIDNAHDTNIDKIDYDTNDYDADEQNFTKSLNNGKLDFSAFKRLFLTDLCVNTRLLETGNIGSIPVKDIKHMMENAHSCWRRLLNLSETLMKISPHYYRLNNYYSNMAVFNWGVDLYGVDERVRVDDIKKSYTKLITKLEDMNLKHEFAKIMKVLPYQDLYCGLILENSSDFFIQQLNLKVCKLYEIQDGIYNFIINLSAINPNKILAYPDYVQQAYQDFVNGVGDKWYYPPADKQVCIKLNSQWKYPYPMLLSIVQDLLDLDTYKRLKMQAARTDNYKAIMTKIPIDTTTVDKPLITLETLGEMAEINRANTTDDIGFIYTLGADGEPISFENSSTTSDNVSDAIDEIYNSSGITQEAFNGSASGTAVTYSIENDSGFVYTLYRQFERWTNRFIKLRKYNKRSYKFSFYILDSTIFNRDTVAKRYKDAVTLGATVIDKWMASLGATPSKTLGSYILHKDIFDYQNNFVPLSSSYNSSESTSSDEVGRPTNADKGEILSDEGEKTADGEKNDY